MRLIRYGDSSFTLRLNFPDSWRGTPTGVNVELHDDEGTELLASTAATILTADTLKSAAAALEQEIELTTGFTVTKGDKLRIGATATGPIEDIVTDYYNSSTKKVYLVDELLESHAASAAVSALFATYALDVSDTDDFPNNLEGVITWTPNTDDEPYVESFRIAKFRFALQGVDIQFAGMWPTPWDFVRDRWENVYQLAEQMLMTRMEGDNLDFKRMVDHELIRPAFLWLVKALAYDTAEGGDARKTERKEAWDRFETEWGYFKAAPFWTDWDADKNIDTDEKRRAAPPPAKRNYA